MTDKLKGLSADKLAQLQQDVAAEQSRRGQKDEVHRIATHGNRHEFEQLKNEIMK